MNICPNFGRGDSAGAELFHHVQEDAWGKKIKITKTSRKHCVWSRKGEGLVQLKDLMGGEVGETHRRC